MGIITYMLLIVVFNRDVPEDVLNAFCWIHSTYTIPGAHLKKVGIEVPFPGVDHTKNWADSEKKYTKYYQWVGFTLFIQVESRIYLGISFSDHGVGRLCQ